jgi:hypothetical protein
VHALAQAEGAGGAGHYWTPGRWATGERRDG